MVPYNINSILSWAEIDLDALADNVRAFRQHSGGQVELMAVVKANAYGHGMEMISRTVLAAGASRLAVHRFQEGVELRRCGIEAPILVMGYTPLAAAGDIITQRLTPTVTTREFAETLNKLAKTKLPVHIKVDTGMGRYGLLPGEVEDFLGCLHRLPRLTVEGIFSHFAAADQTDLSYARKQLVIFRKMYSGLAERGQAPPVRHICNSAAAMVLPEAHFEAIRPGLGLYGMYPSCHWQPPFALKPVLTLKSRVVRLCALPAGSVIGYGCTYITKKACRVALVPVGYGDGYHRLLSNRGQVLIAGQRADILGLVSMDQIVVDVSHIHRISMEQEVTLLGNQGNETITAEEVAGWAQTINYEVTTSILPRVARFYRRNGEIIGVDV